MNHCKDCRHLLKSRFTPGNAAGQCGFNSTRYGADMAWAEVGNQFIRLYVGPLFGCLHFAAKDDPNDQAIIVDGKPVLGTGPERKA